jgi:hypothetical protein
METTLVNTYDFEVIKGEEVISAERSVPLYSPKAAWPKVISLARSLGLTGCRIRVKEQGKTIILIGATAALRHPNFDFYDAI